MASRRLSRLRRFVLGIGLIVALQLVVFTGPAPSGRPHETQGQPLGLLGEETDQEVGDNASGREAGGGAVEGSREEKVASKAIQADLDAPINHARHPGDFEKAATPGQQGTGSSGSGAPLSQEHKTTTSNQDYSKPLHGLISAGSGTGAISWRSVYSQEFVTYTVASSTQIVPPR